MGQTSAQKEWYDKNREAHKRAAKLSYVANRAERQEQCKAWRKANPDRWLSTQQACQKKRRAEYAKRVEQIKADRGCVDCGERDPIVLDFDHEDPKSKRKGVAVLVGSGYSWKTILHEIAKCDVRCANCHRRRTYREQHYNRGKRGYSREDRSVARV